jgi:hypothetical protein
MTAAVLARAKDIEIRGAALPECEVSLTPEALRFVA